MPAELPKILFVVKSLPLTDGEQEIETRLGPGDGDLGFDVDTKDETSARALDVLDKALVVISSTVDAESVSREFRDVAVPVIVTGTALFTEMQMIDPAQSADYGEVEEQTKITIKEPYHPLAAGLSDTISVSSETITLSWIASRQSQPGKMSAAMVEIATLEEDSRRVVLFGYRSGSEMASKMVAPCKRVGLPYDYNVKDPAKISSTYWNLFNAAVIWAAGEIGVRQFDEVFREEWQEIQRRRELQYAASPDGHQSLTGLDGIHAPENLVGLALSGGGIRSATFCLGLLQGLHQLKLLRVFDYLSTVSGGGYLGGWWSAWLARERVAQQDALAGAGAAAVKKGVAAATVLDEAARLKAEQEREAAAAKRRQAIFPNSEEIEPERLSEYRFRAMTNRMAEGSRCASRDPIHHLRLFANYLTPRKGALSGDTWRAVTTISRNLVMTWLILVPLLAAFLLAGQFYFVVQPNATSDFFQTYGSKYNEALQVEAAKEQKATRLIQDEATRQAAIKEAQDDLAATISSLHEAHVSALRSRALLIGLALVPFVGWIALMFVAYMRSNTSKPMLLALKDWFAKDKDAWKGVFTRFSAAHAIGAVAVGLLIFFALSFFADEIFFANAPLFAHQPLSADAPFFVQPPFFGAATFDPPTPPWTFWEWFRLVRIALAQVWYLLLIWGVIALALLLYALPWRKLPNTDLKTKEEWRREVWRNRIIRTHSTLMVTVSLIAVALVFSGFGYEVFDYLWRDPRPRQMFLDYVGKLGGWAAFVGAIAGTIFTTIKAAPSGGHDQGEAESSSAVSNFVFAITPLLLVIVLMITLSWTAHELLRYLNNSSYSITWPLTAISFTGVVICLFFALFESLWRTRVVQLVLIVLMTALVTSVAYIYFSYFSPTDASLSASQRLWLVRLAIGVGWFIFFRLMLKGKRWPDGKGRFEITLLKRLPVNHRIGMVVLGVICLVLAVVTAWSASWLALQDNTERVGLSLFAFAGIVLCFFYVLIEILLGQTSNLRSVILFAAVYAMLFGLLLISYFNSPRAKLIYLGLQLLGTSLTWVVALGWMSDPNTLSMHAFYRGRIVRAYLGASNPQREDAHYEITESALGDDMLLSQLQNCRRGGPYHLLNTTLNLVGGRDLATAQRSSAMFVLSKLYCGSFRTGFRRTSGYMDGRFSLGTAVAVSGAAVSPGMGSGKTTASLAMLMTLMNVRLGYWAPTPSGEEWASAQPRLWPFYIMREFLSQTSDLSSYCYLTDGGHFDNLGLYSLVERGCRYIVVADAVADPTPCFSDLGNAIRRCRIDFDADINLDITPFIKESKDDRFAKQHYATGTIIYSPEHATKLGWAQRKGESDEDYQRRRTGVLVYIKPSLLKDEEEMRADVRQYEIENTGFPQQSTVDQWFDEAQFESYRRLGEFCAQSAFGKVTAAGISNPEQVAATTKINNSQPLTPPDIKALFDYFHEARPQEPAPPENGTKAQALQALKVALALTELEK